jgi:hypothetical protein
MTITETLLDAYSDFMTASRDRTYSGFDPCRKAGNSIHEGRKDEQV